LKGKDEAEENMKTNKLHSSEVLENMSTAEYDQISENKKSSSVICVEDSEVIPLVNLETSEKGQKFISIKIPMYRTTTFLKMKTQLFAL
jgi:hypothetical protein